MAYDPVKAHEYYERYRKKGILKGRKSTKGLSEKGKAIAAGIKEDLMNERKEVFKALSEQTKAKIKELRERMKGKGNKEALKREIEALRASVKAEKEKIKQQYDERYMHELEGLRNDKSLQKTRSKRRK